VIYFWIPFTRFKLDLSVRELKLAGAYRLDSRPPLPEVQAAFRSSRLLAVCASLVLSFVLVVLWPSIMAAVGVMSSGQFFHWVGGVQWRIIS